MANILDYVYWRGDLSFNKSHFNDVDNLILSEICYIDFAKGIKKFPSDELVSLKDAANIVFEHVKKEDMVLGLIVPNSIVELCDKAKDCKRFGSIMVSNYVNHINNKTSCQFSAMCFHLPNDVIYIAFRGTDDTLIGWQENLNMVCTFPVPAQKKAVSYIQKIAELYPNSSLFIGGHSKGGNLATYGAIYCEDAIKERILKVYCNDGPGFINENVDETKFNLIKDKIVRIIPQSSVVGLIFDEFCGQTKIVESSVRGIKQHDGFSWQIQVNSFRLVDGISDNARKLDEAITKMLQRLDEQQRKDLAGNVYQFVIELNKSTLMEVHKDSIRLLRYLNKITSKNKKIFMELIFNFIKYKQL